jgi:hypothetical protein
MLHTAAKTAAQSIGKMASSEDTGKAPAMARFLVCAGET